MLESTIENPTVLIADDDPTMRILLEETLTSKGFKVVSAENGATALDLYIQHSPDAVLLDGEMPIMDGYQACQRMRKAKPNANTPIVLITGAGDDAAAERAFEAGATDFIIKPLVWPALHHKIRSTLRANETQNEIAGLFRIVPDMIFLVKLNGELNCINSSASSLQFATDRKTDGSFNDDEWLGLNLILRERVKEVVGSGNLLQLQHESPRGNRFFEVRMVPKDAQSALAIVRETTEQMESHKKIEHLAYYDSLTNLPNRTLFTKNLIDAIQHAEKTNTGLGLLCIDLDRFKRINDTLGHAVGDKLLTMVAARITSCARAQSRSESDESVLGRSAIARLGGDEFALLIPHMHDSGVAEGVGDRIIESLQSPFRHQGHQFVVSPSIGIATYPTDAKTASDLLISADTAMQQAKRNGRNRLSFFSDSMNIHSLARMGMETDLREAIQKNEFQLYYQPKLDLRSLRVVGVEALIRWEHSELGFVSPAQFIPIAEDTGLIVDIGRWVIESAVRQLSAWRNTELANLQIAVNVSGLQFTHCNLQQTIMKNVTQSGLQPRLLEIEITESVLMGDSRESIDTLQELREAGISVAIDDFGTGYSSLAYLKKFPVDKLKIDRSFVTDMVTDKDDAAICAGIIALGHQLGLSVVAEGVETAEQVELLCEKECDEIQGYYFCPPLPINKLVEFVHEDNNRESAEAQVLAEMD